MERQNKKVFRSIDMIFYWVRDRIRQNHFRILWEEGEKPGGLCHKTPPNIEQQKNETKILKTKTKCIENSKYRQNGTGRGCAGTTNYRVTQKLDNTLKRIRNPISLKLDIPLKGSRNLVPNRFQGQWKIRLTVPT